MPLSKSNAPNSDEDTVSLSDEEESIENSNDNETDPSYEITNEDRRNEILDLEDDNDSDKDRDLEENGDNTHKRVNFSTFPFFNYCIPN